MANSAEEKVIDGWAHALMHLMTTNSTDDADGGACWPGLGYPDSTATDEVYCSAHVKHGVTPVHPDVSSAGSMVILKDEADYNIHWSPYSEDGALIDLHISDEVAE